MTDRRDNVLIVHWHDLGRYLGVYGHSDVSSPRLDQLAAEGILFTRAHATAPLCSPSRGSLFTGRYPQSNGLVGLAHHGWEYRAGVRTLPHILSESGWYTALFGMQHETSYPARLGFDEFDVSNSYCEYVVEHATQWLTDAPRAAVPADRGLLRDPPALSARPLRARRTGDVAVPDYLPDTDDVRQDLAEFYGVDRRRGRRGRPAARHAGDHRPGPHHLGGVHDRPRPGAAPRQVDAVRRRHRHRDDRPPAARQRACARGLRRAVQRRRPGAHPARAARPRRARRRRRHVACRQSAHHATDDKPVRSEVYTTKTYHDSFDPIRAIRTKEYSYIENYANRPLLDLPWDIADSAPGKAVAPFVGELRPERELYDLLEDPGESHNLLGPDATDKAEAIADDLALLLNDWRLKTNDVIPSEFAGTRISERYTETYLRQSTARPLTQPDRRIAAEPRDRRTNHELGSHAHGTPRHIWYSRRNAAAARCSSNRFGPPAWPANPVSSSSTCRPPVSRRSRVSGSRASRTSRSCACWIRWTRAGRTSRRRRSGVTTSARWAGRPTASGAAS